MILARKEADLGRVVALRQRELSSYRVQTESLSKLLHAKVERLRRSRGENESLRQRIRHLEGILSDARK
jgi:hypothetical protein